MTGRAQTGGVKPMAIAGRFQRERERCLGMTDEDRAYRKQWLKDQIISENEPRYVPELYKELNNPIKRLYRAPLDAFGRAIAPRVGNSKAMYIRYFTGKMLMGLYGTIATIYYFKYLGNDWTKRGGWRVIESRVVVMPGDPGYPRVSDCSKGEDYASRGFKDVKLNL